MVDYVEVAKYPLLDIKNFFIGFVMGTLWFLIVPLIFVYGYIVESIRETINQSNKLPHWFSLENWLKFFKHGLFVFAIGAIYLLPPLIISAAASSMVGNVLQIISQGLPNSPNSSFGISLMVISFVLILVSLFLLPMAIILYSATEDIRYAIDFGEILPRIKRAFIPYLKAYVVSIAVLIISLLILILPGINFLFGGVLFYPLLFSARLFAEVFREYE